MPADRKAAEAAAIVPNLKLVRGSLRKCPDCKGGGEVSYNDEYPRLCRKCEGTGRLDENDRPVGWTPEEQQP